MPGAINRLRRLAADLTTRISMSRAPTPRTASPVRPANAAPAARTAYLVLGMHRSGTSAVTQLLALAGASLPANVMPGDAHNEKGYFEPWKIAIFNDERLRAGGSAWDDIFALSKIARLRQRLRTNSSKTLTVALSMRLACSGSTAVVRGAATDKAKTINIIAREKAIARTHCQWRTGPM